MIFKVNNVLVQKLDIKWNHILVKLVQVVQSQTQSNQNYDQWHYLLNRLVLNGYSQQLVQLFIDQYKSGQNVNLFLRDLKVNTRKLKLVDKIVNNDQLSNVDSIPLLFKVFDCCTNYEIAMMIQNEQIRKYYLIDVIQKWCLQNSNDGLVNEMVQQWAEWLFVRNVGQKSEILMTDLIVGLIDNNLGSIVGTSLYSHISRGIQQRIDQQGSKYQSALILQKKLVNIHQISTHDDQCPENIHHLTNVQDRFGYHQYQKQDQQEQEQQECQEQQQIQTESGDEQEVDDLEMIDLDQEDRIERQFYKPQHLQDILLGIQQTENRRRLIECLKQVPFIDLEQQTDMSQLVQSLLKVNPNLYMITSYEGQETIQVYRKRALEQCLYLKTKETMLVLVDCLDSKIGSLSEKYDVLEIIQNIVVRMDKQNQREDKQTQEEGDFYFQKNKTTYYDDTEQRKIGKNIRVSQKLKKQLLIVDNSKMNLLNQQVPVLYFPLLVLIRNGIYIQNPSLLSKLLSLLTLILSLTPNSLYIYQQIQCLLNMINQNQKNISVSINNNDLNINGFLDNSIILKEAQLLLQICNIVNKNVIMKYKECIQEIIEFVKNLEKKSKLMEQIHKMIIKEALSILGQKLPYNIL